MYRRRSFAILAFSSLAYLATRAGAQQLPLWERIGPEGGSICALAVAPSKPAVVYAGGADGGVYRSGDRGLSWSFAGQDLGPYEVCSLAIEARNPARIWALAGGRLFFSANGGTRWVPLDAPVQDVPYGVVAHPTDSRVVFLFGNNGLRRSKDGGVTWSDPDDALPPGEVRGFVVDRVRPDHMFAIASTGLFRSLDGGRRWTAIGGDLPASFGAPVLIALDARDGQTLYTASSAALYRSEDQGRTWRKTNLPQDIQPRALEVGGRSLYVGSFSGLWVSRDGGRSFPRGAARFTDRAVAAVASAPYGVLAATTLGVHRSTDGGSTFTPSQRGLRARSWSQLEIDPEQPDLWYALDLHESILRSTNSGASWRRGARQILALDLFQRPGFLEVDSASRVYTGFATIDNGGELARSDDGAAGWNRLASLGCAQPAWVVADPERERLFAGGYFLIGACGLQPGACAVFRSLDDGETFSCAKDKVASEGYAFALHPSTGDLYAGRGGGLSRSSDWGDTWELVASGFAPRDLAISTADTDLFYGVFSIGFEHALLYRSVDRGLTWTEFDANPPSYTLYPDPFDADRIYALGPTQLYVSDGHGWELAGGGAIDVMLNALAFDPRTPDLIYAAATAGGLLRLHLER